MCVWFHTPGRGAKVTRWDSRSREVHPHGTAHLKGTSKPGGNPAARPPPHISSFDRQHCLSIPGIVPRMRRVAPGFPRGTDFPIGWVGQPPSSRQEAANPFCGATGSYEACADRHDRRLARPSSFLRMPSRASVRDDLLLLPGRSTKPDVSIIPEYTPGTKGRRFFPRKIPAPRVNNGQAAGTRKTNR
jgi:hypothetical protein